VHFVVVSNKQTSKLVSIYQLNAQFLYSITVHMLHYNPFTESDDTRCCSDTICPPEDAHSTARNMLRIIM